MRRIDWRLLALAALYAAVVIPVSLPKGSDFDIHLQQTELLLADINMPGIRPGEFLRVRVDGCEDVDFQATAIP